MAARSAALAAPDQGLERAGRAQDVVGQRQADPHPSQVHAERSHPGNRAPIPRAWEVDTALGRDRPRRGPTGRPADHPRRPSPAESAAPRIGTARALPERAGAAGAGHPPTTKEPRMIQTQQRTSSPRRSAGRLRALAACGAEGAPPALATVTNGDVLVLSLEPGVLLGRGAVLPAHGPPRAHRHGGRLRRRQGRRASTGTGASRASKATSSSSSAKATSSSSASTSTASADQRRARLPVRLQAVGGGQALPFMLLRGRTSTTRRSRRR